MTNRQQQKRIVHTILSKNVIFIKGMTKIWSFKNLYNRANSKEHILLANSVAEIYNFVICSFDWDRYIPP